MAFKNFSRFKARDNLSDPVRPKSVSSNGRKVFIELSYGQVEVDYLGPSQTLQGQHEVRLPNGQLFLTHEFKELPMVAIGT